MCAPAPGGENCDLNAALVQRFAVVVDETDVVVALEPGIGGGDDEDSQRPGTA